MILGRGIGLQFNRILLKKITKQEESKFFNVNTLTNFDKKILEELKKGKLLKEILHGLEI